MPTARIITQNRESASPVARELQSRGYVVEIVSPEKVPAYSVDLEIDMGRYAAGATGSLITSSEDVNFAHDQVAPSPGHLEDGSQSGWSETSDLYEEEYPVEREFVLAPLWRSFCSRLEGLRKIFRSHAAEKASEPQAPIEEPCLASTQQSEAVVDQARLESIEEFPAERVEIALIASQEQAEAPLPLEANSIEEPVAIPQIVQEAGTNIEKAEDFGGREAALDPVVVEESQVILPAPEPVVALQSDHPELADTVGNVSEEAELRAEASDPAEHITFEPPSRVPKDPALVAAALHLEALLESSRSKASDLWIQWKDLDWSWIERGLKAVIKGAQRAILNTQSQLRRLAVAASASSAEMRERLRQERPRERTLAYSFVLAAILAGFFLLGWIAAMRLTPQRIQAEPIPQQLQPAANTKMPAVLPAAAVVPPAPARQDRATEASRTSTSPAVKAKHSYRASVAEEDSAEDVVIRHFGQKPKSVNNTASVKHYSDLEDQ